jgi:hypothetical protein
MNKKKLINRRDLLKGGATVAIASMILPGHGLLERMTV